MKENKHHGASVYWLPCQWMYEANTAKGTPCCVLTHPLHDLKGIGFYQNLDLLQHKSLVLKHSLWWLISLPEKLSPMQKVEELMASIRKEMAAVPVPHGAVYRSTPCASCDIGSCYERNEGWRLPCL